MDVCAVVELREVAEEFGVEGRTWAWSNQKVDPLPIKISNTHDLTYRHKGTPINKLEKQPRSFR